MGGKNSKPYTIPYKYQDLNTLICLRLKEGIIRPLEDPYLYVDISKFLIEAIEESKNKLDNWPSKLKSILGKTIPEAQKLFSEYTFEDYRNRADNEVFYEKFVSVELDKNSKIIKYAEG